VSHGPRAFTLLEILLSIALVGLVFVGLNTFIFSMGELWGRRSESRLLELHVRAVTRFLDQQLHAAMLPPEAQPGTPPVAPQEIRPLNGASDNLLTFELPNGCRLFNWPGPPLPDVICSLQVRTGEGLFLLWHSKLEKHFSDDPPREVLVTPFVTSMAYDYYESDSKRWQTEIALRRDSSNQPTAPQRLRLHFTYGKLTRETIINLSTPGQGLPDY
jgi:prepilin-type N-terminal cleavage/methylation domain-containing protein